MTVAVSTVFIPVHDPEEALRFYRDALGLEVRNDVAKGEFRWVTVGAPGQHVDIVLSQPPGGRSQTDGDALLELVTNGSIQAAIFSATDLDATFEQVRASGTAEVLPGTGVTALRGPRLRVPRFLREPRPHRPSVTGHREATT